MPSKSHPGPNHSKLGNQPSVGNQPFEDVDTLKSSDGLMAVISQRRGNGVFTFAVFREFERDGEVQRGAFVPENLGLSYIGMVQRTLARIDEIRKSGKYPFAIR